MNESIKIEMLSNGLTVIAEEMPQLESAAYELAFPGGILADAPDEVGAALILGELTCRGAGDLDSRALSEAFDNYGIRHGEGAGHDRYTYRGTLSAEHLDHALGLVALMVREPLLPEDEIDDIRSLLLQDIASLADNPARRTMVELSKRYYPAPFNRPSIGEESGLAAANAERLRSAWQRTFAPRRAILSVAGNIRAERIFELARKHFGAWNGEGVVRPPFGALPAHHAHHIQSESAQLQIALAYPSAAYGHEHYYAAKVTSGLLSGGMFGRLFIEVREKRGLCYSVYARHHATNDYGTCLVYAGTTPERADQTLAVMLAEVRGLAGTVTAEELQRAKSNIKAGIVIGEESPGSRVGSNLSDWWLLKRVRSFEEICAGIDAVSISGIDRYLAQFAPSSFMLVTLGAKDLRDDYRRLISTN